MPAARAVGNMSGLARMASRAFGTPRATRRDRGFQLREHQIRGSQHLCATAEHRCRIGAPHADIADPPAPCSRAGSGHGRVVIARTNDHDQHRREHQDAVTSSVGPAKLPVRSRASPTRCGMTRPPLLPQMLIATAATGSVAEVSSDVGTDQNAPCAAPSASPR